MYWKLRTYSSKPTKVIFSTISWTRNTLCYPISFLSIHFLISIRGFFVVSHNALYFVMPLVPPASCQSPINTRGGRAFGQEALLRRFRWGRNKGAITLFSSTHKLWRLRYRFINKHVLLITRARIRGENHLKLPSEDNLQSVWNSRQIIITSSPSLKEIRNRNGLSFGITSPSEGCQTGAIWYNKPRWACKYFLRCLSQWKYCERASETDGSELEFALCHFNERISMCTFQNVDYIVL